MGDLGQPDNSLDYISSLPKTAIQALYHAVTGKTETLSKWLRGNVVVRHTDFCRLYSMLQDQWGLHPLLSDPTVTIIINTENDRKIQYSSWSRFQALQIDSPEITSDIVLKIELLTELPNTTTAQRCIINIDIDSALPLVESLRNDRDDAPPAGIFMAIGKNWRTVAVSIDFVDYILAKNFLSVVEEWFKSLEKIKDNNAASFVAKNSHILNVIASQSGRIGAAFFLVTYYISISNDRITLPNILFPVALCLLIWSMVQTVSAKLVDTLQNITSKSVLPSSIILTEGDKLAFGNATGHQTSFSSIIGRVFGGALFAVLLNVIASYLFVWLEGR